MTVAQETAKMKGPRGAGVALDLQYASSIMRSAIRKSSCRTVRKSWRHLDFAVPCVHLLVTSGTARTPADPALRGVARLPPLVRQ
jgi:hypothetical protein